MKRFLLFSLGLFFAINFAQAQGAVYTLKGGLTLGTQSWDNQLGRRQPLLSYHIVAAIEELSEDPRFTIFAQAGYHARGTSLKTSFFHTNGARYDENYAIQFNNLALAVGAKKDLVHWASLHLTTC